MLHEVPEEEAPGSSESKRNPLWLQGASWPAQPCCTRTASGKS